MEIFPTKESSPDQGPEGEQAPKRCVMGSGVSTSFVCLTFYSLSSHLIDTADISATYKRIFYQPDSRWKEFFPHSYTLWELKKQNKTKQNKKNTKWSPEVKKRGREGERWK